MKVLGFIFEFILELILDAWFDLMQWIIPDIKRHKKLRIFLKILIGVFSFLLFMTMVLGICAIISDDPYTHLTGMYMFFIPFGISTLQIIIGIIIKIVKKRKNR